MVQGDIFTFMSKLLKHQMKRSDDHMTKELLKQKNEQIKDESVKAEWKAVVAASKPADLAATGMDDLTKFRKKKEKELADKRPATAPIRGPNQPAAEFQSWPGNEWSNKVPRGLASHRSHSAKLQNAYGKPKVTFLLGWAVVN